MRANLNALDAALPIRYSLMVLCAFGMLLSLFSLTVFGVGWAPLLICAALVGIGEFQAG